MHINSANIKFRQFPILTKFNGRENLCSRKLISAKINVLKVLRRSLFAYVASCDTVPEGSLIADCPSGLSSEDHVDIAIDRKLWMEMVDRIL